VAAYFGEPALSSGLACHVIAETEEHKNQQHHSAMVSMRVAVTRLSTKKIHRSRSTAELRGGLEWPPCEMPLAKEVSQLA